MAILTLRSASAWRSAPRAAEGAPFGNRKAEPCNGEPKGLSRPVAAVTL
jgi:hypothetical protein